MSERVARPSFYEGQILRAADLDLGQEYGRGALARHERYLHTPGIATGLELTVDKSTGVVQVRLSPGMAIDGTGRQVVVDREEVLAPEELDSQGVLIPADTDASIEQSKRPWHPIFLAGRDESVTPPSLARGCGGGTQPNRTDEAYAITYGRPGDEPDPPALEVSDGPESTTASPVIIGYVQWDGDKSFADAKTVVPAVGLSPALAGVRADEVVSRFGALALRADRGATRDQRPALVLDDAGGGSLRFGLQDEDGKVQPVFSVNSAGDVECGTIKTEFGNDLWVESGTLFDGMTIPLPAGVTQEKVDEGKILLHVTVTPRRVAELFPPGVSAGAFIKEPFECRVDGRRVFVRDRWFNAAAITAAPILVPAACDYVVVASVAGGTS